MENMPKFIPKLDDSFHKIEVQFDNEEEMNEFIDKTQISNIRNRSAYYPSEENDNIRLAYYGNNNPQNMPKYPIYIYIVSKGRWEHRFTSDSLIRMGIKHYIVVEESQYDIYKKYVDSEYVTLLILDQKYLDEYDTCDDLGNTKSKGPGAARNFAWNHSKENGHKRHWVMDDNINEFYRLDNNGKRIRCFSPALFRAMEDHADQYSNVAMSGPAYRFFTVPHSKQAPFTFNTRIYSCNLILNEVNHRWAGRYNEDTHLSLLMLKDNWVTLQYNIFMQNKLVTQAVKGGNTEEFYSKEGTLPKSKMLEDLHPDVSKVVWKYGRWHHYVDYTPFKDNELIRVEFPENKHNEYDMEIKEYVKKQ